MTKKDFLEIVRSGAGVSVNASIFSYEELRQLVDEAASSGATIHIHNTISLSCWALRQISSTAKGRVFYPDIKVDTDD